MNDYQFKLVKILGDFVWHDHKDTDEVFFVIDVEMSIAFRDGEVKLSKGEMYVIPKGVEHKPYAEKECHIMLVEPKGVVNTGETNSKLKGLKIIYGFKSIIQLLSLDQHIKGSYIFSAIGRDSLIRIAFLIELTGRLVQ